MHVCTCILLKKSNLFYLKCIMHYYFFFFRACLFSARSFSFWSCLKFLVFSFSFSLSSLFIERRFLLSETRFRIVCFPTSTARFDTENVQVEEITKAWLNKHGIKYDKLIVDAQNKGDIAKENNIDLFVDDSIINCISVANKGIKSYIMENRCNIECNHPDVKRVYSWPHLEQEIRKEIK